MNPYDRPIDPHNPERTMREWTKDAEQRKARRLTKDVRIGLTAIASMIEAGPFISDGGDLADVADEVEAALKWIHAHPPTRSVR